MSAEINKILCAILSSILVLLLSSFIGELLYHPDTNEEKVSYLAASSEDNKEKLEDKDISKEKKEYQINKQNQSFWFIKCDKRRLHKCYK